MQIEVRITTLDYELGFELVGGGRFPGRRPIIVPGEAIISGQNLIAGDESIEWADIIELGIDINEDTSISLFAEWLHSVLQERAQKISSLVIGGVETPIDEAEILRAIEQGIKETAVSQG